MCKRFIGRKYEEIIMDAKRIIHGSHKINDDTTGYMYSFNTSPSYTFGSHMHKCYEFLHIVSGELIYMVENTEYLLTAGDMVMTKPSEFHSFSFTKECEYQREFLHIYPGYFAVHPELIEMLESRPAGTLNRISAELMQKYGIDDIFCNMRDSCADTFPETDSLMYAYAAELVLILNRVMREENIKPQEGIINEKADSIRLYIDCHYTENLNLDDIAAAFFLSTGYMLRLFKKETGMTPKAYLNMRRVTHAKNLIMQGRRATSIYSECGFNDYSSFYRSFVKYTNMTPEEFKRFQQQAAN